MDRDRWHEFSPSKALSWIANGTCNEKKNSLKSIFHSIEFMLLVIFGVMECRKALIQFDGFPLFRIFKCCSSRKKNKTRFESMSTWLGKVLDLFCQAPSNSSSSWLSLIQPTRIRLIDESLPEALTSSVSSQIHRVTFGIVKRWALSSTVAFRLHFQFASSIIPRATFSALHAGLSAETIVCFFPSYCELLNDYSNSDGNRLSNREEWVLMAIT